ncbi:hypothetical protein AGRO_2650 [Agrobacterium sp. ATCC 31749]|uniref:gp53-like domain-containing protein n=1 Tax=unclassified Agrobacterium TaxID=2632611 RepID=UPI00020DBCBC|nr:MULTISPECIES: hypothetical protein [unclassified Agrobacterium]EGL64441.1 hypothetical protein AGRO_2650 [Agrobacterium sp. ATCC 31749]QKW95817.1 hypothetical protein GSF67_01105 [Agrobacterium sp. CGMCC 11546]
MTAPYTAGTINLVSGSAAVVGTDTAWQIGLIIGGTIYVEFDGGNPLPIATVDGDTEITAALKWTGPTGTYSYAIVRDTAYGQQTVANAQALATYIQRLNNPALAATAGVTPGSNKLLLFTGANSATVIDLEDILQGVKFDEEVPTLADRAAYDGEAEGFRVLVADVGDGRSAFFSKKSATAGDWTVPFYITGPVGGAGPYTDITIGDTTTLPAGSEAEVTLVPVSPGVIRLDFGLPKGADGTGDVNGPNGGVVDGRPVAWDGNTGKFLKPIAGPLAALHALIPSANTFPYFTGAAAAALADLTPFARSLLDDANGAAVFSTLGTTQFLGGDGFVRLPNGLMIQWGQRSAGSGVADVLFPTAFPNAAYRVIVGTDIDNNTGTDAYVNWSSLLSLTGFRLNGRFIISGGTVGPGGVVANFIAIGR